MKYCSLTIFIAFPLYVHAAPHNNINEFTDRLSIKECTENARSKGCYDNKVRTYNLLCANESGDSQPSNGEMAGYYSRDFIEENGIVTQYRYTFIPVGESDQVIQSIKEQDDLCANNAGAEYFSQPEKLDNKTTYYSYIENEKVVAWDPEGNNIRKELSTISTLYKNKSFYTYVLCAHSNAPNGQYLIDPTTGKYVITDARYEGFIYDGIANYLFGSPTGKGNFRYIITKDTYEKYLGMCHKQVGYTENVKVIPDVDDVAERVFNPNSWINAFTGSIWSDYRFLFTEPSTGKEYMSDIFFNR